MNAMKKILKLWFLPAMLVPLSGCSTPDVTLINAKTGRTCSPSYFEFRQVIVDTNPKLRQFNTLLRTEKDTAAYITYDENCRKLDEQKLPMLVSGYAGEVNHSFAARGGKIAYVNQKTLDLRLYDLKTGTDKIVVPNVVPENIRYTSWRWAMQWLSDSSLFLAADNIYIIDMDTGKQKAIYNITKLPLTCEYVLSPDAAMLAFNEAISDMPGVFDETIKILDIHSGEIIKTIKAEKATANYPRWSFDSKTLAYVERNREKMQIKVISIADGKERTLQNLPPDHWIRGFIFGKDFIGYTVEKFRSDDPGQRYFIDAQTGEPRKDILLGKLGSDWLLDNDVTYICTTGI